MKTKKTKELKLPPMPTPFVPPEPAKLLKLDLGCGKNKKGPEWTGVDSIKFDGVDIVCNLAEEMVKSDYVLKNPVFVKWPWEDNSVDEVHSSHFIEHLDAKERVHFCNELYRILKPGAKAHITAPWWANERSIGDLTHKWPAICGMFMYYLDFNWRQGNAPHLDIKYNPNGLNCHFNCQWGHSLNPSIASRNQEYQQHAIQHWVNTADDVISTWTKSPMPESL
jgi:hypothetical protein